MHADNVIKAIAGRSFRLLGGSHKDVVQLPQDRLGVYGWHRRDGRPLQPVDIGRPVTWTEYPLGVRLARRFK